MAGRPRKKAERVAGLEEEALALHMGVFSEMPKQYRERPDHDPLCQAWNDAKDAVALASIAMQKLGDMLRKKANITEPGPCEKVHLDDDGPYKPVSANWNLLSACAGAVRRRAQLAYDLDPARCERLLEAHEEGAIYPVNGES